MVSKSEATTAEENASKMTFTQADTSGVARSGIPSVKTESQVKGWQQAVPVIVFTDMDGTLLDHHTYSFEAATPALNRLAAAGIPVIPVTSKTRAELNPLMSQMALSGPFIVENGAGVYVPQGFFAEPPAGSSRQDGFWCYAQVPPRSRWLALLEDLKPSYEGEFTHFAEMGLVGVQAATELPAEAAALALQRDFAEPVQWLGSIERKAQFIRSCEAQGAHVLQGGRFLHVGGAADKGLAARWLCEAFVAAGYPTPKTIGLGDSHNDVALLNAMDQAVIVRGVKSEALQLSLPAERVTKTEQWGPVGWCAAMEAFLEGEAL